MNLKSLISVFVLLLATNVLSVEKHFDGSSGSNSYWDIASNWSDNIIPTNADDVKIILGTENEVVIRLNNANAASVVVGDWGWDGKLINADGALSVVNNLTVGYNAGDDGYFDNAGTVTVGGDLVVARDGNAILNMFGGQFNIANTLEISQETGKGYINLLAGEIIADSFVMKSNGQASMNVLAGELLVSGDQTYTFNLLASNGYITAYDGWGNIQLDYNSRNPGYTTVYATDAAAGSESIVWKNNAPTTQWNIPSNWNIKKTPRSSNSVGIYASSEPGKVFPIIQTGIIALTNGINIGGGAGINTPKLTMIGGSLEHAGNLVIGDTTAATFEFSGGTITSPAWISVGANVGGLGTFNMTGGSANVTGLIVGYIGGAGVMHLDGGILTCENLVIDPAIGYLDITAGTLIVSGDISTSISDAIQSGTLTGYGKSNKVVYDYNVTNSGKTTIMAIDCEPADLDGDCDVDPDDLSLFISQWLDDCDGMGCADYNNNSRVDYPDYAIFSDVFEDPLSPIGATPIRFYSGNLSGEQFINYWGTPTNGTGAINSHVIELLLRNNCSSICDYVTWCVAEQTQGVWDWSFFQNNADSLDAAGLGYNVFCWLHFPPRWYQDGGSFVPYKNLETGNTIAQLSLWSPDLESIFDNFYSQMLISLGSDIDFVRIAMPSEYGEIGYCSGMTDWLVSQPHAAPGYWCGDDYAKAAFREDMISKYGSVANINSNWQTSFADVSAISMPNTQTLPASFATSAAARRYWIDFIDWYHQAWDNTLEKTHGIVSEYFGDKELIASIGYGSEKPMYGNDQGRYVKTMARLNLSCQSPGDIGYLATRRVSSAARHYGSHYITEPPSSVSRDRELNRIFMDISNGVESWFDYLDNLDQARDYFRLYKKHLTGASPRTNVAVWHPTADHWLHPTQDWSEPIYRLSDEFRDVLAYEVLDDRLILDDALVNLNIRQLVLFGAQWLDSAAWAKVHQWVASGGVLIVMHSNPIATVNGSVALWDAQTPSTIPQLTSIPSDLNPIWQQGKVVMGNGAILTINVESLSIEQISFLAGKLTENAGSQVGHPEWNAKQIDGKIDGVLCTRFDDKILYYNTNAHDVQFNAVFRESDFPAGLPRPLHMTQLVMLPARTIIDIPLLMR